MMKYKKTKRNVMLLLCITMLMGCTLVVSAVNCTGIATVRKTGVGTVYSATSGGTLGLAKYNASCDKGTLWVEAQEWRNSKYMTADIKTISSGRVVSGQTAKTGCVLWRIKLSGATGRGYGSIKAQ